MALRPEELLKLPWQDVKDSFVYVHTDVSKTGDRAELPILPALQRWLAICRERTGMVAPRNCSAKAARVVAADLHVRRSQRRASEARLPPLATRRAAAQLWDLPVPNQRGHW